jgi:FKBP-type peptidyl-prolyl cis-trans isomerase (trigger factor)
MKIICLDYDGSYTEFSELFQMIMHKSSVFNYEVILCTMRYEHEIDDEFYGLVGVKNIEDLTVQLQSVSEKRIIKMRQDQIRQQVASRLVEGHEIQIPKFVLDSEMQTSYQRFGIKESEVSPEQKEQIQKMAERNIKLSFILDSIRDVEPEAVLNDNEARENLVRYLAESGQNPKDLLTAENEDKVRALMSTIKDEFVLQYICDKSTIVA